MSALAGNRYGPIRSRARGAAVFILLLPAALAAGCAGGKTPPGTHRPLSASLRAFTRKEIARGVWILSHGRNGPNAGVIQTRYGPVVVDAGEDPNRGEDIVNIARRLTRWKDVAYLVLTRPREEAVMGVSSFLRAEVIATEGAAETLATRREAMQESFRRHAHERGLDYARVIPPTLTFSERLTLRTPGRDIRIMRVPGAREAGECVVYLPAEGILFAGDLASPGAVPNLVGVGLAAWTQRVNEIEALKPVIVVPGEGPPGSIEMFAELRGYVEALADAVAAARAAGVAGPEDVEFPGIGRYRGWRRFEERHAANVCRVWEEMAAAEQASRAVEGYRPLPPPSSAAETGEPTGEAVPLPVIPTAEPPGEGGEGGEELP